MKIALCNPPWLWETGRAVRAGSRWPHASFDRSGTRTNYSPYPFWLAYSAAILKLEGHDVAGFDALAQEWAPREFIRRLKAFSPDLVLFESSTPSHMNDLRLARRVKNNLQTEIVFAGSHITCFPEEIQRPEIDYALIGEYEYTLRDLANVKEQGTALSNVAGLVYKSEDKVKINKRRPLIDLDELPMPAFGIFSPTDYFEPFAKEPNVQLLAGRGCPFKCIFCLWPATLYGLGSVRYRSPAKVIEEVRYVLEKFNPREIYFDDDTFTYPKKKVLDLCREIKNSGLSFEWAAMGHCSTVTKEMLECMHNAGCEALKFGIESGSNEMLIKSRKGLTTEKIKKVFKWCREIGIRTHATIMIGLPGENWDSIKKTFKLILESVPDGFQASIAVPFPGTEFYKIAQEKRLLETEDFEDLAFSHFAGHHPIIHTEELTYEEIMRANRYANDVLPTLLKIEKAKRDPLFSLGLAHSIFQHPIKFLSHLRKLMSSSIPSS